MDSDATWILALVAFVINVGTVIGVAATGPGAAVQTRSGPFIVLSIIASAIAGPVLAMVSAVVAAGSLSVAIEGWGFGAVFTFVGGAALGILVVPFSAAVGALSRRLGLPLPVGAVGIGTAASVTVLTTLAVMHLVTLPTVIGALVIGSLLAVSAVLPWIGGMLRDPAPATSAATPYSGDDWLE